MGDRSPHRSQHARADLPEKRARSFSSTAVFDALSRDRRGGLSRDAVARLKRLDTDDDGFARRGG
jgi:hypothetical protein